MTTQTEALEALAKHLDITQRGGQYEIRCKICRKGWGMPLGQAENFNPLGLFDHAFSHQEQTDDEKCIE